MIESGWISDEMLQSPLSDNDGHSYYYVPSDSLTDDPTRVLLYTDPALYRGKGGRVGYHDNQSGWLDAPEFDDVLSSLTLPDGTPWAPHLDD